MGRDGGEFEEDKEEGKELMTASVTLKLWNTLRAF